jgi:hypothetical protein
VSTTKALRASTTEVRRIDLQQLLQPLVLPSFLPANIMERINALTDKSGGPDAVWPWLGEIQPSNGYPRINFVNPETRKREWMNIHRILLCIAEGRRLGRKEFACHKRGYGRTDVNPGHLYVGDHRANMDDADAEHRWRPHLTKAQVLEIVQLIDVERATIGAIAHRFSVTNECISRINDGRTWSKLTGRSRDEAHRRVAPRKPKKQRVS